MTDAKKLWEAWGQANALYTDWAASRDINSYRLFVLYAIDGHDAVTQKMIAEFTGLSKQTVNTVIRALRAEGILTLSAGSGDRREKLVKLTDDGLAYASQLLAPLYALENSVVELIGMERVREMMNNIRLFTTVFEKELENQANEQSKS